MNIPSFFIVSDLIFWRWKDYITLPLSTFLVGAYWLATWPFWGYESFWISETLNCVSRSELSRSAVPRCLQSKDRALAGLITQLKNVTLCFPILHPFRPRGPSNVLKCRQHNIIVRTFCADVIFREDLSVDMRKQETLSKTVLQIFSPRVQSFFGDRNLILVPFSVQM